MRTYTPYVLLVIFIGLLIWDIYLARNKIKGDTISEVSLTIAHKHPILPFGMGIIAGHLFWPQRRN